MLTKSLHTVTAASHVARHLIKCAALNHLPAYTSPHALTGDAMALLGYDLNARREEARDDTVARIVKACAAILGAP